MKLHTSLLGGLTLACLAFACATERNIESTRKPIAYDPAMLSGTIERGELRIVNGNAKLAAHDVGPAPDAFIGGGVHGTLLVRFPAGWTAAQCLAEVESRCAASPGWNVVGSLSGDMSILVDVDVSGGAK